MSLKSWLDELSGNEAETIAMRRHLHQHPEPSFEEKMTAQFIEEKLVSFGISDYRTHVGNGYGIVARIKGNADGPTIALRADFDALRITEEVDVEFKSKNEGVMHACGHDVHASALLSVAKVLQKYREELKGTVVFLFQNAEEIMPGGAKSMIEAGALEGVDKVFGIHVITGLPAGKVSYSTLYGSAAADSFEINIQGRGGHAARPHQCVDSVVIAAQIIANLQTIVSRMVDPVKPAVLTFASVSAGATAANIVADTAKVVGTVRTLDPAVRQLVKEKLVQLSDMVATIQGGTGSVNYIDGYPSLINTEDEVALAKKVMTRMYGADNVSERPISMVGEDFSYFLEEVPGAFVCVGAQNPDIEADYPHHHPKFKVDERCIKQSGELFLGIVAEYLLEDQR